MSTDDPDVVSVDVFITTSRQEVLLQLRDDQPDIRRPAHWVVPGGHREPGETPHRAAVRELREETGLHVPGLPPFHPVPAETDLRGPRRRAFHAQVDVDPAELVPGEGQELRLVPFAGAQRMTLPPALKGYLRQLEARLTAGRTPEWAVVDDIHRHISAHRAGLGLSLLHLQVVKIQEEAGEAAEALLGVLGANPRKGVSHTVADLQGELCDVITAAMVALRDTTADPGTVLAEHLARWQPSRLDPEG